MAQAKSKSSVKVKVQKFGTALSGMIMPNIGAIIAWGLTAAFFMYPHGWFPNKEINNLVQPMLHYLLPLLIGYTGGRMVYEERGAIAGAIGTLGVIVGTDQPMFLGAMIMGPLSAWLLKKLDQVFQDKIKSGFEMIYNNFSLGILGMIAAIFAFFIIGPIMEVGSQWASAGVNAIIRVHLLPLANIIIEPAKVLFLNNAIGNGILVPLGIQQAAQVGKSVLFLMESNPGPGLGILLVSAKDAYFGNIVGVLGAAVVSFIIAAIILKNDKSTGDELEAKQAQMQAMKAQSKGQSMPEAEDAHESVKSYANVKKIIFACDAGMGSSAMGASLLRDKFKKAGIKVSVTNTAVRNLKDEDGLLIITQEELADRALQKTPHAMHVAVGNFLSSPKYDTIVASFKALTQVEDKPKAEKPVKKVGSLEGIDFSKVKEVDFIRHDQHLGTATMATSLFNDAIKKAGKTTPVKAVRINELTDDPSHLVIVTPAANKNLAVRYSDIQTLVVDDLLKDKKLGEAIQKLN